MLSKKIISTQDYSPEDATLPVLFEVRDAQELSYALRLCSSHKHKVRGLSMHSSLLLAHSAEQWPVSHFSIILDDVSHLDDLKSICGAKKYFFELRVPLSFVTESFLCSLESVQRLFIRIEREEDLVDFDRLVAQLIAHRQFPFFEGAPMCRVGVRYAREFYHQFKVGSKGRECSGCDFATRCAYKGGFRVSPLQEKEAQEFISHEDLTTRF